MANLTDADKVLRNDTGKSIVSKLDGIKDAIVAQGGGAHSLDQLSDVDIDSQTLAAGQSIVYNDVTEKFENGQVSTVGGLNDLNDVTITSVSDKQELVYDDSEDVFKNKTTRVELTQAEYNQLVDDDDVLPDVDYYITDAPSMQGTSADLSYDGGTDSVYDVVEEVKGDVANLSAIETVSISTSGAIANLYQSKANKLSKLVVVNLSLKLTSATSLYALLCTMSKRPLSDMQIFLYSTPNAVAYECHFGADGSITWWNSNVVASNTVIIGQFVYFTND